ncbi:hypothetical protein [Paenibacillus sp. CF384]|uniref:hypothetical protein n=1 Tax=Paenibacillus sp. CF384 TaxID=1884382 RepID=UPI0008978535|nr:hypothetical protein [Paenibacillus sp. CF384]SDW17652.1 hypothetical protein SAMN05518855_1001529 [Paenibacillus sp. CF384]
MAWMTLMDHDLLSARLDTDDQSLLLEINDGGFSPEYVTIRLGREDVELLEEAIRQYKDITKK